MENCTMTDDEADAGLMRLVRKYGDIKKKIVCVGDQIHEMKDGAENASMSLRNMNFANYERTKAKFDAVPWAEISSCLGKMVDLSKERGRIEECLREASLGDMISQTPSGGKIMPAGDDD